MAFANVVPVTLNVAMREGLGQSFQSPAVKDFAGAVVDLSAWVSLAAKAVPPAPGIFNASIALGTVTASAGGILTLTTSASDLTASEPGTCQLIISGKPTSGDALQTLATGILTLSAS